MANQLLINSAYTASCGVCVLRHTKPQTTARYIHAVNVKQIEAQGKYLDAIKLVAKDPDRAA
jgi:hypothetical protein